MAEVKNIPKLRFPEFKGEWKGTRFEEIYSFYSTNSLSREKLNYEHGNVRNIHYGDIHTKYSTVFNIREEHVPFINMDIDLKNINEDNFCKEGDIVIADASEDYADIGKCIELKSLAGEKLLAGLHTLHARPRLNKMAVGFTGHLMKTWSIRKRIMIIAQGTKVLSLSTTRLGKIQLSFPEIIEQQKIASFLTSIDNKIQQLTKKKELLEQYKKGVMQKIFKQEIRFKDDEGNEFPEWEEKKLNQLLYETKKRNYDLKYERNEVLSVSGLFGIVNQIELQGRSFAGESIANYHVVEIGDIVYTKSPLKSNPYGIIKVNKGNAGIVSTLYAVYGCKENVLGEYLDFYFQLDDNTNQYLRPLVRKGAKNDMKINNAYVLSDSIFIPSKQHQFKVVQFLNLLDNKIELHSHQLDKAKAFKKGLLQQMFV